MRSSSALWGSAGVMRQSRSGASGKDLLNARNQFMWVRFLKIISNFYKKFLKLKSMNAQSYIKVKYNVS